MATNSQEASTVLDGPVTGSVDLKREGNDADKSLSVAEVTYEPGRTAVRIMHIPDEEHARPDGESGASDDEWEAESLYEDALNGAENGDHLNERMCPSVEDPRGARFYLLTSGQHWMHVHLKRP